MKEETRASKQVIRGGDRILLLVLSLAFIVGFGGAYYAINDWQPNDNFEGVLNFLGRELTITLLLFAALVMLRCFVTTERLEKALASVTIKVLVAMTLACCAVLALLVLAIAGHL